MTTLYSCDICNYKIDVLSSYKKHLITKKHINRSLDDYKDDNKIVNNPIKKKEKRVMPFTCDICKNIFKSNYSCERHYIKCVEKLNNKNEVIMLKNTINELQQQNADNEKINLLEHQLNIMSKQLQELKDLDKKVDEIKEITNKTYNINNNNNITKNNKCVNFYFIQENFKNPMTLEECASKPLSQKDRRNITKSTPIIGCEYLIKSRCINDIDVDQRPFHSLDISRDRFAVYCEDEQKKTKEWLTKDGSYISSRFYPIVEKEFRKTCKNNTDQLVKVEQGICDMRNNPKKLHKSIANSSQVKNSVSLTDLNSGKYITHTKSKKSKKSKEFKESKEYEQSKQSKPIISDVADDEYLSDTSTSDKLLSDLSIDEYLSDLSNTSTSDKLLSDLSIDEYFSDTSTSDKSLSDLSDD